MAEAGIDHVMTGDHVMFHDGVGNDGLADAASLMTATEDLGVYLAVYLMVLRHPVIVARQILTVAQFGPGRLSLGLGIGGDDRREVAACGVDPRTRGRRMDEALGLVRRLLSGKRSPMTESSSSSRPPAAAVVSRLCRWWWAGARRRRCAGRAGWGTAGSASGPPPSAAPRRSRRSKSHAAGAGRARSTGGTA